VIHAYIVEHDIGFAPNPFFGYCTVACCKPRIREKAELGSWVVGVGSVKDGARGKLIYAMQVTMAISFQEYWNDGTFEDKKPTFDGSLKQAQGDNIYSPGISGEWQQCRSRHTHSDVAMTRKHVDRDTSTNRVLISNRFVYLGQNAIGIPAHLRDRDGIPLDLGSEHTPNGGLRRERDFDDENLQQRFVAWLNDEIGLWGYQGDPIEWRKAASIKKMLGECV